METVRDLVVRIRLERVGTSGDWKTNELKAYKDEITGLNAEVAALTKKMEEFRVTTEKSNVESKNTVINIRDEINERNRLIDLMNQSTRITVDNAKESKKSTDDFKREISDKVNSTNDYINKIKETIEARRKLFEVESQASKPGQGGGGNGAPGGAPGGGGGASAIGGDSLENFRREMQERLDALKEKHAKEREGIEIRKKAIDLDMQATAASKQFYLAFRRQYDLGGVETINRLARGTAWLVASNKENSQEMARSVLQFQAAFDLGRGLTETVLRLRNAYVALSAAVAVYNAAQAAGGATATGAKFMGVGGALGGRLAALGGGAAAVMAAPLTWAVAGLGAVAMGHWGSRAIQRGESSMFESTFNLGSGMKTIAEYKQMQQARMADMMDRERTNQSRFSGEFDLRRQAAGGSMFGLAALTSETRGNIASNQAALKGGVGDEQKMMLTSRVYEDFKRLEGLLREEAQIKEETSRNAIRGETERLHLLEKELHQSERIYETKKREIEHGASSFAQMRPWEQRRAKDAFANLQAGRDISRRDRDLLESIGTTTIREALQKKDMAAAMRGGFGGLVSGEQAAMDSAGRDVEKRKADIEESEKSIKVLQEEAEKTGQAFADKTKEVMQRMLEAYRAKMDAEQTVENNAKAAQRGAAGL